MRLINIRKLALGLIPSLCVFAGCVSFWAGVGPGVAAATQLGATQFGQTAANETDPAEAGQIFQPKSVAVNNDPSSLYYGDVYVVEQYNARVDRFSGSGAFQLTWGWGVATGANELQTCTTVCQKALEEEGSHVNTGSVANASGVAVDSEALSSSAGDVYVEQSGSARIEKFGPSGEFLLMFGGGVNETTGGNVCRAGENCKRGTEGSANGQFEGLAGEGTPIAVGPGGRVYVGDRGRVQVFESSGAWMQTISLAGLSSAGNVTALAVDASGDVFVKDSQAAGVRELEPNGTEKITQFDAGSTTVTAVTVNGPNELFVGESSNNYLTVLRYKTATGKLVGSFGSDTVRGGETGVNPSSSFLNGLAFSEATDEVYASEFYIHVSGDLGAGYWIYSSVWGLPIPPPGPSIERELTTPAPPGGVILEGSVNPEGNTTGYHFEYVDEADFKASGFSHAVSTPAGSLAASVEGQLVSVHLTGLAPNVTYYYRIVASNVESVSPAVGAVETFGSLPAASIESAYVTDVASSSATINAQVNPLGSSTDYSIEYGPSSAYGHAVTGYVGEGTTAEPLSRHLQELSAGATYHFRVVLRNGLGTVDGPDHTFTTQSAGGSSTLIDGRSWELVSPVDKHGALIELTEQGGQIQAASDGRAIAYITEGGSPSENPAGKLQRAQVLSRRGPAGWSTEDLTLPTSLTENGEAASALYEGGFSEYHLFSPDLSQAVVEPQPDGTPLLSPEATERTLYLRDDSSGIFSPLVDPADVPSGAKIEESNVDEAGTPGEWRMHFLAATPDLGHVVFGTPMALTPEAIDEESVAAVAGQTLKTVQRNLYEWSKGKLQLVNILPETDQNEVPHSPDEVAHGRYPVPVVRLADMADGAGEPRGGAQRDMSSDGRRIAWMWGQPHDQNESYRGLYVRDMVEERTVKVGGPQAVYQTMNSEGSEIFYLENGDLFVYNFEAGTTTDLTAAHGSNEPSGGVQNFVSDVSEDGAYVYFVATGVLAEGAVGGTDNLYVMHDTGGGWTTTYIASLSIEDQPDWYGQIYGEPYLTHMTSRVSPDGHYLAFMSNRSLTGYDNTDAVSGQPDEEVYEYDAQTGALVCASCDPTGARPEGVDDSGTEVPLLVDRQAIWTSKESAAGYPQFNHWLAGSVPGWVQLNFNLPATHQPRYLSDSGRLFFDSPVGLVPRDTNKLEDVYEWEPEGVGGCTSMTSSATDVYVKEIAGSPDGGCVGLISSGTSSGESAFFDASENGDDVFFDTTAKLTSEDEDKAYDLYDAHVCTVEVPCKPAPVSPPPCDSGDSCKAAPSPQPAIFGAPPSATFNGAGNVAPAPTSSTSKRTTKALECKKGRKLSRGKCVKSKKKTKAKKASNHRRARS